jgi:hypothetical protein
MYLKKEEKISKGRKELELQPILCGKAKKSPLAKSAKGEENYVQNKRNDFWQSVYFVRAL